jgi:hypothetical protein
MAVVAKRMPEEADSICSGLADELSIDEGGMGFVDADTACLLLSIRKPIPGLVNSASLPGANQQTAENQSFFSSLEAFPSPSFGGMPRASVVAS